MVLAGFQVEGLSDGDSVIGKFHFKVNADWDLENLIGLDVSINGKTVGYFADPPFEGDVSLEPFSEGEIEVRFQATFFGGLEELQVFTIQNIKSAFEQRVHLIQIPITLDSMQGPHKAENYRLFVNDHEEPIADVWGIESPLELVILLDTSGSMKERLPIMRLLIRDFLNQLRPADRVKVIGFYHRVYEIADFTTDKQSISKELLRIQPGGDTNLYGALWAGVLSLAKAERRRGVLLLTDGRHQMEFSKDVAFQKDLESCIDLAREYMVPVYVLGVGHGTDPEVLSQIADGTAGRYFQSIKRKKIEKNFKVFLEDLRQQVVLGYYHDSPSTGWHKIHVEFLGSKGKITAAPEKVFIK